MNVLRDGEKDSSARETLDPFVLKNRKVMDELLRADERGRITAGLHLSAKLEEIFGNLIEQDYKTHFGGKVLTRMWTLSFVFTTMAKADPSKKPKERGLKRRKTRDAVESDAYNRRLRLRWNLVEKLRKLQVFARSERRQTIENLLGEIRRNWHIATEKNYAFRSNLSSDDPNSEMPDEKKKIYVHLSEEIRNIIFDPQEGDAAEGDVTSILGEDLSSSYDDISIGGAVYDKCLRFLRNYIIGERYDNVVDIHIHADTPAFLPLQRSALRGFDSLVRQNGKSAPSSEEQGQNHQQFLGDSRISGRLHFSSPKESCWRLQSGDEADTVFFGMMNCLLMGKAAVEHFQKEPVYLQSATSEMGTQATASECFRNSKCSIYLHGVAIAISDGSRAEQLCSLQFSRHESSIMVSSASLESGENGPRAVEGGVLLDARGYAPNC